MPEINPKVWFRENIKKYLSPIKQHSEELANDSIRQSKEYTDTVVQQVSSSNTPTLSLRNFIVKENTQVLFAEEIELAADCWIELGINSTLTEVN